MSQFPVSVLAYLENRRNRVDVATRGLYEDGGELHSHDPNETRLFLIAPRADLDVSVIQISDAVRMLIQYCDGMSTAEEIAAELGRSHPQLSTSLVVDWLHGLQDQDIVRETWTYDAWRETAPYLTRGD